MEWLFLLLLPPAVLIGAYVCYFLTFRVDKKTLTDPHVLLEGEQYEARRDDILSLVDAAVSIPYEDVYIQTNDGLRLHGAYYAASPDAPVVLMVHGYKSIALRDFCGALQEMRSRGFAVLLVDQRAHGQSDGRCLTFGIRERFDCLAWVDYLKKREGEKARVLLLGVSMGAATVLMAAGEKLPSCVRGVLADSSYTAPAAIIKKVLKDRKLPRFPFYPLVWLGALLFGHFRLGETTALDAVSRAAVPILFVHGDDDRFVPCEMCRELHESCKAEKTMLLVSGAGHGMGLLIDPESYGRVLTAFLSRTFPE